MKPTLTILHKTDNSERIAFDCRHANTASEHVGGNGDTLRAALGVVLARHAEACRCAPEVVEDFWESMAHMRATMERDLADKPPADPRILALVHQDLDSMRRHSCPCDPHVITTARFGVIEFTAYHREDCNQGPKMGDARILDLLPAGMLA